MVTKLKLIGLIKTALSCFDGRSLLMNDVLVVSSISKSLLSVSKLTNNNSMYVGFSFCSCLVKDKPMGLILLERNLDKEGLHKMKTSQQEKNNPVSSVTI